MADLGTLTTTVSQTGKINSSFNQTIDVLCSRKINESVAGSVISIPESSTFATHANNALHGKTTNFIYLPVTYVPLPIGSGKISGVVKVEGIILAQAIVKIIHKETGFICAILRTDNNGYFETFCVQMGVEFYAIAHHPDYNAAVVDSLFAVPM